MKITLKMITMWDLADGISGIYKGKSVDIKQVGRQSYVVRIDGICESVGGVDNVKRLLRAA